MVLSRRIDSFLGHTRVETCFTMYHAMPWCRAGVNISGHCSVFTCLVVIYAEKYRIPLWCVHTTYTRPPLNLQFYENMLHSSNRGYFTMSLVRVPGLHLPRLPLPFRDQKFHSQGGDDSLESGEALGPSNFEGNALPALSRSAYYSPRPQVRQHLHQRCGRRYPNRRPGIVDVQHALREGVVAVMCVDGM